LRDHKLPADSAAGGPSAASALEETALDRPGRSIGPQGCELGSAPSRFERGQGDCLSGRATELRCERLLPVRGRPGGASERGYGSGLPDAPHSAATGG